MLLTMEIAWERLAFESYEIYTCCDDAHVWRFYCQRASVTSIIIDFDEWKINYSWWYGHLALMCLLVLN